VFPLGGIYDVFPLGGIYDTQGSARGQMMWKDTLNLSSESVSGSSLSCRSKTPPTAADGAQASKNLKSVTFEVNSPRR